MSDILEATSAELTSSNEKLWLLGVASQGNCEALESYQVYPCLG